MLELFFVYNEKNEEKLDVIKYDKDPAVFIAKNIHIAFDAVSLSLFSQPL